MNSLLGGVHAVGGFGGAPEAAAVELVLREGLPPLRHRQVLIDVGDAELVVGRDICMHASTQSHIITHACILTGSV